MAEAKTGIEESQAGAQTGGAQSGAGAEGRSAASQTQQDQIADINLPEIIGVNAKRLLALELNLDALLLKDSAFASQRVMQNAIDFDKSMQNQTIQIIQGAVERTNRLLSNAITADGRQGGNDETSDKVADITQQILSTLGFGETLKGNAFERAQATAAAAAAGAGATATGQQK